MLELQRYHQSIHPTTDQPNLGAPQNHPGNDRPPNSDLANMKLSDKSGAGKRGEAPGSHAFLEFTFKRKCNSELESQTPFILKYDYDQGKMVADLPRSTQVGGTPQHDLITRKILQCMRSDDYHDTDLPMPSPPAYPDDRGVKIGAMGEGERVQMEEGGYPRYRGNQPAKVDYTSMRVVDEEVYF